MYQVDVRGGRSPGRIAPTRVVLADDNPALLAALHDLIASDPAFLVIGTATDGRQALDLVSTLRPDILLTDRRMPHGGTGLVAAVRAAHPNVTVLCLSADESGRGEMLAAGAVDYLVKGRAGDSVLAALHRHRHRPGQEGAAPAG